MATAAAAMNDSGLWLPGVASTKEDKIEKWWEVNRKHDPPLTRGATPLVERCMRTNGWSESFTKRTLKGYRQFMELKSVMNDWQESKLSAPEPVQDMWEQHILDNLNYTDDCYLLFGRMIGHNPDATLHERATMDRIKTTKIAFQARYGADLDPEVWDFSYSGKEVDSMRYQSTGHQRNHSHQIDAMDTEIASPEVSPQTPRGRLPVAGTSASRVANSKSPRSRFPSASLITSSDEENSPRMMSDSARDRSPARSPTKSDSPPKSPTGNEPITIFLRDSHTAEETYFSLRYKSTLRIVFTVFAERKGFTQESLKFTSNGQALTGYETPHSLGLEDRARIDVHVQRRS